MGWDLAVREELPELVALRETGHLRGRDPRKAKRSVFQELAR